MLSGFLAARPILGEDRMDEVAVFINLRQDAESDGRFNVLQNNLPNVLVNDAYYGAGQYSKYAKVAKELVADFPNAKVFFSPCWPSLDAISQETQKPIVFAGLVTNSQPPLQSTGIVAFDINALCPNWPALLRQIAPNMTKAAVIYDGGHPGPQSQFTAIQANPSGLQKIIEIPAQNDHGTANENIAKDIKQAAKKLGAGAGLIVTACTITGLLREQITSTAKWAGLIAIYPDQMYVMRTGSLGLMSYGPDLLDVYKQAATDYAAKILGGISPANLPSKTMQQGDFKLIINKQAAQDLKLTIPAQFTVTFGGTPYKITPTLV
jgi:ABC-type uncharacterized transport system substrate-binding protein